ncbi:MAG: hypothetical protein IT195_01035 [Microthrixaceae bacterium]|nr:hypothetical protein [Microthrixaceae bacterium]
MATIVINTDDLRELARRIRAAVERIDQVDRSLRQRAASDPLLGAHTADLQRTLGRLREVRNVLSRDHNELVREITQVEQDEGTDPGDRFVAADGVAPPARPTENDITPLGALISAITRLWGSGLNSRAGWVTAGGAAVASTETLPVPGYGSAWDEAADRALRDELHRPRNRIEASDRPSPERGSGPVGGDGPGEKDAGARSGTGADGDGSDEAGGRRHGTRAGTGARAPSEAAGERPGGASGRNPGRHDGAPGGVGGPGPANAPGDGPAKPPEGTGDEGSGQGEGSSGSKGEGGEKSGGGGFGGGSIGDFFDAILENPISAVLAALPLLSNPVGWLGAVALVAMYADELIAGISELINDPEAFVAKVGEFMGDSLEDLMSAAEDFVTDPLSAVGDTITTAVEGAADEVAGYLQDLQDDPLGTILETVAEVAKLAGVDAGAIAGEAFSALGEVAPELIEMLDDLAKAADGIADVVDTALDTAEVVGDVLAGAEAAQKVLTALGLDEIAGLLPTAEALVDLVPGATEFLDAAGIDPSELTSDLDLGALPAELQDAFRSAVDVLPIDELPEGLRSAITDFASDLRLDELDELPGKIKDRFVESVRGLAPEAMRELVQHIPSEARAAFERVLHDSGLGGLDLSNLDLSNLDFDDLPDHVTDELVRALGGVSIGDLPAPLRSELTEALGRLPVGMLDDMANGRFPDVGSLLSGIPLDQLGAFPDEVRDRFAGMISALAAADPEGFAERMLADAASRVPSLPALPDVADLLGGNDLDDLVDLPGLPDLTDLPGLPDLATLPDDLLDDLTDLVNDPDFSYRKDRP